MKKEKTDLSSFHQHQEKIKRSDEYINRFGIKSCYLGKGIRLSFSLVWVIKLNTIDSAVFKQEYIRHPYSNSIYVEFRPTDFDNYGAVILTNRKDCAGKVRPIKNISILREFGLEIISWFYELRKINFVNRRFEWNIDQYSCGIGMSRGKKIYHGRDRFWLLVSGKFRLGEWKLVWALILFDEKSGGVKTPRIWPQPAIKFHIGDVRNFEFPSIFAYYSRAATSAVAKEDPLVKFETIVEGTRHTLDFIKY